MVGKVRTLVGALKTSTGFLYGAPQDVNDQLKDRTDWPIVILFPVVLKKKATQGGVLNVNVRLQGAILRIGNEPDDKLEGLETNLDTMEASLDELFFDLSQEDDVLQVQKPDFTREYKILVPDNRFDEAPYGLSFDVSLNFMESKTGNQ